MTLIEANAQFVERSFVVSGKTIFNVQLKITGYYNFINSLNVIFNGKEDVGIVAKVNENKIVMIFEHYGRYLDITKNKQLLEYIHTLFKFDDVKKVVNF